MNNSETDTTIIDRQQEELPLRESHELFKAVFENGPALTTITDVNGKVQFCSPQCEKVIGWPSEDIVGLYMPDFIHPDDKAWVQEAREKASNMEPLQEIEYRIYDKQNKIRWISHSISFVKVNDAFRILSTITNISERKNTELELNEAQVNSEKSENRYRLIANNTSDSIWAMDADFHFTYLSPSNENLFGYSLVEWETLDWNVFVHPDYMETILTAFGELKSGKERTMKSLSASVKHKNGAEMWVEFSATGIYDDNDVFTGVVGVTRDVTERKLFENALRESEFFFKESQSAARIGSYQSEFYPNDIWKTSKVCDEIFGMDEGYNKTVQGWIEFLHPEDAQYMIDYVTNDVIGRGIPFDKEYRIIRHTDGATRWVLGRGQTIIDENGRTTGLIGTIQDITERKKLEIEREKYEQALQQTQKLESLGVLAGGIAHDFNNLMGGIYGFIDLAHEETDMSLVSSYLTSAMNTIDRARDLTGQLLTFAKGGDPIQKVGHLFPFIEENARFALSGANVSCQIDVQHDLWTCNFDQNQIGQVIDNLIINAQQAMPVGGTIKLTARNITLGEKEHPTLKKDNYVIISVKDCGIGIQKELLAKIFDPFFTTKTKGHGLGLATCFSIVNRHGGCIEVESQMGSGSTFHVYLPASTDTVSDSAEKQVALHKGSGTFLIMDDEEVMRKTIQHMLQLLGYTVVSRENGQDAIDFFVAETKANRKITGMIFDLTVPGGMGGKAAIEEIRKIDRAISAFVASGYAEDPVMKNPTEYGFMASICKPFRKVELSEMLNKFMKVEN